MAQKKSILVPLDGSQFGECAIPIALEVARRRDAELEMIVVFEDEPSVAGWPLSPDRVAASFAEYLDQVAARLGTAPRVPLTKTVEGGNVTEHLVKHAGRWNTELVVMSTHGRGAVSRAWLGSVADTLVREATVPVLLIRPVEDQEPDLAARPSFSNVLVALDGSARAERCLEWATRLGGTGASYTFISVVTGPIHSASSYLPDAIRETAKGVAQGRTTAKDYLAGTAERLRNKGYTIATEVVDGVPPASGILRFAEGNPTDLIAITTHGRSGLSRLLLGSVADKVVRGSPVPVLVERAAD